MSPYRRGHLTLAPYELAPEMMILVAKWKQLSGRQLNCHQFHKFWNILKFDFNWPKTQEPECGQLSPQCDEAQNPCAPHSSKGKPLKVISSLVLQSHHFATWRIITLVNLWPFVVGPLGLVASSVCSDLGGANDAATARRLLPLPLMEL